MRGRRHVRLDRSPSRTAWWCAARSRGMPIAVALFASAAFRRRRRPRSTRRIRRAHARVAVILEHRDPVAVDSRCSPRPISNDVLAEMADCGPDTCRDAEMLIADRDGKLSEAYPHLGAVRVEAPSPRRRVRATLARRRPRIPDAPASRVALPETASRASRARRSSPGIDGPIAMRLSGRSSSILTRPQIQRSASIPANRINSPASRLALEEPSGTVVGVVDVDAHDLPDELRRRRRRDPAQRPRRRAASQRQRHCDQCTTARP